MRHPALKPSEHEVGFVVIGHSQFDDAVWEVLKPLRGRVSEFTMAGLLVACGCRSEFTGEVIEFWPVVTVYWGSDMEILLRNLKEMVDNELYWIR